MIIPLAVFGFFLAANVVALLSLFANKHRGRTSFLNAQRIRGALSDAVLDGDFGGLERLLRKNPEEALMLWRDLRTAITFSAAEIEPIQELFRSTGIERMILRRLRSGNARKRYGATHMIRPLVSPSNIGSVIEALRREKKEFIRLSLVKDLLASGDKTGFDGIAESLDGCSMGYFKSVRAMMASSGHRFIGWAHNNLGTDDPGRVILILSGAMTHVTVWLKDYVQTHLGHDDPMVRSTAIETAEAIYPDLLAEQADDPDTDIVTRRVSIRCLAQTAYPLDLDRFVGFFSDPTVQDVATAALTGYVSRYPEEVERIVSRLRGIGDPATRRSIASCLAGRLPFLLVSGDDPARCRPIVEGMLEAGKSAGLIAFLNYNRDPDIEDEILGWIEPYLGTGSAFRKECAAYLEPRLRAELGIEPYETPKSSRKIPLSKSNRIALAAILGLIILFPIAAIAAGLSGATIGRSWIVAREAFRRFTWGFGFYAVALNCIYLALIYLARINLLSQAEYWKLLDREYLFTPGLLPSISILAPAYNEAKTVVQSVQSLLTLAYPDFQVIVINDGSSDDTMGVLSEEFALERIDPTTSGTLPTAPVRGVYRSPGYAKLLVIDKENGGKADALNAGIDLASCEYICSIDADSLLEPDALLRMTAQVLTSDVETVAVGGNILPVNGCAVERGMLQSIALPENRYARLQTIEYLRSFIAGRLGWSQLNALLIISGAFGLFRRDRVLEIGGYMTGRGEFNRDTVGEDMELVVRLVKRMGEARKKYRVRYASSANCWTEVPEDLGSLFKQRDRWHRGLIEIMTWHREMLFNPKYGTAGLLAFPYFLIFEVIGPFYEFAGYPLLFIGFATGALHWHIFAIMFSAVLLFGLLISTVSLMLSERGVVYFRRRELAALLGYSVIENFGFRQLMGWVRVFSSVSMLVKNKGWQKLERKGFSSGPAAAAAKP
ncbi:MAG: hypothetical protein CVV47_11550 [Spirochaetae bacterium HGW-Spirochaetae-3]|jgi:cellulose synthase/poly-beta-1,6-N-acetylglucosamine synthase-like glycosyltransferase|nr:MAG: hypothetical protein CVV47_11550 [Spirochaetae bacterium HGW-Spirochaetae-3]